jgi:hypothetical protein
MWLCGCAVLAAVQPDLLAGVRFLRAGAPLTQQQANLYLQGLQQRAQAGMMLPRQYFGWRQKRCLCARFNDGEHGGECDQGFARADVAL